MARSMHFELPAVATAVNATEMRRDREQVTLQRLIRESYEVLLQGRAPGGEAMGNAPDDVATGAAGRHGAALGVVHGAIHATTEPRATHGTMEPGVRNAFAMLSATESLDAAE